MGNPAIGGTVGKPSVVEASSTGGPHAVDWVLDLVPHRVRGVTEFHHKLVWHKRDIEDHSQAILLVENGVVADISISHIAAIGKPLWRILGSLGAILDSGSGGSTGYQEEISGPSGGSFELVTVEAGASQKHTVPYMESDWLTYYSEVANHLLHGGPVPVSGEDGRRTIAILEATERSAQSRKTEPVEYE